MKKNIFIIFTAFSLFTSCKSAKTIQAPVITKDTVVAVTNSVNVPVEDSAETIKNIYNQIQNNRIRISTFSAKMDVKYKDAEGKKYDINANIRMYYDSVIWVSVTGLLGIEGLRGLITHDSIKLIDKQNKIYTSHSISYLQEITNLPLDLVSLQDLILGNPVFWNSTITFFSRSAGSISLLSIGDIFKNLLSVNEENKMIISSKLDDIADPEGRTSSLLYNNYENKKGVNFSVNRIINVTEKKKLEIEIDFRQYNFNETLSFPFTVPKNYKRN